jgi:cell division septation protein DedD
MPPGDAPSTASATTIAARGAYLLRFGAFLEPENAMRFQNVLKQYGYAAEVVPYAEGGKILQLVQVGGFADREAATEAAISLQRDAGIEAMPMRLMAK